MPSLRCCNCAVALVLIFVLVPAAFVRAAGADAQTRSSARSATLIGRAVLPAETFAEGPPSGSRLGDQPRNGVAVPFPAQPLQGLSGVVDNRDGTFWALVDNGYGGIVDSADFHLRLYRLRPDFQMAGDGTGSITVVEHVELRDPHRRVAFPIRNHFSDERVLTGADFDPESLQRAPDGTLWIGDEFGPFLLHVDDDGILLEPPIPLPDLDNPAVNCALHRIPTKRSASPRCAS